MYLRPLAPAVAGTVGEEGGEKEGVSGVESWSGGERESLLLDMLSSLLLS